MKQKRPSGKLYAAILGLATAIAVIFGSYDKIITYVAFIVAPSIIITYIVKKRAIYDKALQKNSFKGNDEAGRA